MGPYKTSLEFDDNQPAALQQAIRQYVTTYLGRDVRLTPQIRRRIVQDQWQETNEYSVGPMIQRYVLLGFDDVAVYELQRRKCPARWIGVSLREARACLASPAPSRN